MYHLTTDGCCRVPVHVTLAIVPCIQLTRKVSCEVGKRLDVNVTGYLISSESQLEVTLKSQCGAGVLWGGPGPTQHDTSTLEQPFGDMSWRLCAHVAEESDLGRRLQC
jgi:hypothetical protein